MSSRYVMLLVVTAIAVPFAMATSQQPAPPGQIRPRPGTGRQPEWPPPNIRDYHPKSTLVVPEHSVPRAKFPVIDVHAHQPTPISPQEYDRVVQAMDRLNLRVIVNPSGSSGAQLREGLQAIRASRHPDRMVLLANVDFNDIGPGSGVRLAKQLEEDIHAGAVGLKVFKNLGLFARKADGSRLKVDDPELDPIWETCARLSVPVLIHTGEPAMFFEPIDFFNERWLELSLYPDRRYQDRTRFPTFEALLAERDRMFVKHRNTRFMVAHMGWHANDLARLGAMMDRMPNIYPEVAAVLYDLGRQPRVAHDFFVKYQDRVLFGKDSYQPDEYPYYWRTFETADEYFDYYRDYHAFWKLYGMNLPDAVLRKLYYANALNVIPGLPKSATSLGFGDGRH